MNGLVKVRVTSGYAVYDGETQRGAGEVLEVPDDLADRWAEAGWVTPVPVPAKVAKKKPAGA